MGLILAIQPQLNTRPWSGLAGGSDWAGAGKDPDSPNEVSHPSLCPIHRPVPSAERLTAYLLQGLDRGTVIFAKALSQLFR
jgi:hypothetical protein